MTTSTQGTMTTHEALDVVGITAHDHDMRMKFQECFVCGGSMNYMRFFQEHKHYCAKHEGATGDLAEAIRILNG